MFGYYFFSDYTFLIDDIVNQTYKSSNSNIYIHYLNGNIVLSTSICSKFENFYSTFEYSLEEFKIIGVYLEQRGCKFYYEPFNVSSYIRSAITGKRNLINKMTCNCYITDVTEYTKESTYIYRISTNGKSGDINYWFGYIDMLFKSIFDLEDFHYSKTLDGSDDNSIYLNVNTSKLISVKKYINKIELEK